MLGFTFITDSKLSMYREKAIKSENLAKEIEEMQDKADFTRKGFPNLSQISLQRIKRFYLLAKIFLSLRKRLTP